MDEKLDLEQRYYAHEESPLIQHPRNMPSVTRFRRIVIAVLPFVLPAYILFMYAGYLISGPRRGPPRLQPASFIERSNGSALVPLEAHVMSKCPDARDCLRDLVVPAMEKISEKVDFRLSYIANIDDDGGIRCMHGETECLGDMLSLCADNLYSNDTKVSLGFSTCLIMSYARIPQRELVESCALEHGVDFQKLNGCISEEGKGLDLLRASVERSLAAGATTSCTVRLEGKQWCVRDGGQWKNCDSGSETGDLVKEVEKLYGRV